jgi:outer membrane protein OmpA-like peptidoglycan-associated protein
MKFLTILAAASMLGACGTASQNWNPSEVGALPDHGDQFHQALHRNYVKLAQWEKDEDHWNATSYYDVKARQAAAGKNVQPTGLDERSISAAHIGELTDARGKLMNLLAAGGARLAPEHTAYTQAMFDCWTEEQEEGHQPDDIAFCRNGFMSSLAQASSVVYAAAPAPQVAAAAPRMPAPEPRMAAPSPRAAPIAVYTVYFDHDSSKLDAAAMTLNQGIVDKILADKTKTVMVNGYTDRSGDRDYNRKLAERRAATVVEMLEKSGIRSAINFESFGEDRLEVETADNVREKRNRRVVVTLE